MSTNKLKIIGPLIGMAITATLAYDAGKQQSKTAVEVAKINAETSIKVAEIQAKMEIDKVIIKSKNDPQPFNSESPILNEINKSTQPGEGYVDSPLENTWLKDLSTNFDLTNLPSETLIG